MAMMKKKETAGKDGECCGSGCCGCGCGTKFCGWFLLVWGIIFLAYGMGYFQAIDFLKNVSAWSIFGVGIAVAGLFSVLHGMFCKCCE